VRPPDFIRAVDPASASIGVSLGKLSRRVYGRGAAKIFENYVILPRKIPVARLQAVSACSIFEPAATTRRNPADGN